MINKQNLPPPPRPDEIELKLLADTIKANVDQIETARKGRIELIQRIRAMHRDDYSHRAQDPESIWALSNIGVPLIKGVATSYAAKIEDELVSAEKFFQVRPQNPEDKEASEKWGKYWQWEILEQIKFRESASEAINVATSEGTAILKRGWLTKRSYYPVNFQQVHDENGKPISTPEGDPVGPEHRLMKVDHPNPVLSSFGLGSRLFYDFNGTPGPEVLPTHEAKEVKSTAHVTHYDNAEFRYIPFEDFYCSLSVASIDKSPLVGHAYDILVHELWDKVKISLDGDLSEAAFKNSGWDIENLQKIAKAADAPSTGEEDNTAHANAPIKSLGEAFSALTQSLKQEDFYKKLQLMECYLKYDINNDGILEDIIVLWDRTSNLVLWVDYHVNVYVDCKLPFDPIGFIRIPGRWFCMGPYEYLQVASEFVDKVFNRMNYRSSMSANPMSWVKKDLWIKAPETWGPGEKCELKGSATAEQGAGFIQMPIAEQVEWQHFQFFISLIQLVTGISSAAQGDVSSLPQNGTATGITSIVQEGNKLYRMYIRGMQSDFQNVLSGGVRLIQQNLNQTRVFRFSKGLEELASSIEPEDIQSLEFDVQVVLSKTGMEQKMQGLQGSLQIVQQYVQMTPQYQIRMRPIFIQLLTTMGIVEAESILPTNEELLQDQNNDSVLQQAAQKLNEAILKIQGANLDAQGTVIADLTGILPMLQQVMQQPPAAPEQPAAPGAPQAPRPMEPMRDLPGDAESMPANPHADAIAEKLAQ